MMLFYKMMAIALFIVGSGSSNAYAEEITLEGISKKVSEANYLTLEEALRVYQAKKSISAARGDLLPSLNVWKIAGAAAEGASIVGIVGALKDMAPFLVPNNWFRVRQTEILYEAQQEGYRALWANQVFTAKSLFLRALFDARFAQIIREQQSAYAEVAEIAQARVEMGMIPLEVAKTFEIWQLDLVEDRRTYSLVFNEEVKSLSYVMGFENETNVTLKQVSLPNLGNVKELSYGDFIYRAVNSSPERRQHGHFLRVVPLIKKEMWWSFLGASTISRGTAGGVFNNMPESEGLGFSTAPKIEIIKGQESILETQQKGIIETVKRQLDIMIKGHNSNLASYKNAKQRLDLSISRRDHLRERLEMGDRTVDLLYLGEVLNDIAISKVRLLKSQFAHLMFIDKLERLIFAGDYQSPPAELERL